MRSFGRLAFGALLSLTGCYADPGDIPSREVQAAGESGFRVIAIDVGQGEATAVITPGGCAALFDGGPTGTGAAIRARLRGLGVTALDFAVVSHYHADHIGGIDEVEQGTDAIPIATVFDRGGTYSTATYTEYSTRFAGRRNAVTVGQTISLCGEATVTILAVNGNGVSTTDENALSVVARVSWQGIDLLAGGDVTGESPDIESVFAPSVGPVEAYLVHHHGSRYSSNATLLGAITPVVGFISVGSSNSYGHPTPEALARLAAVGTSVWQTGDPATGTTRGSIELRATTGTEFTVTQGVTTTTYAAHGSVGDTQPPTTPTGLAATPGSGRIDLGWTASTDNVGVTDYRVYRDGALRATVTSTTYADTGLGASESHGYTVRARDAAGNESPASTTVNATTFCTAAITTRTWNTSRKELTLRATCSSQPTATMTAYANGVLLGTMTWKSSRGSYEIVRRLTARPPCANVVANCGGTATSCF